MPRQGAGCQPSGRDLTYPSSPGAGEVTVDGREVTLPFAGAELSVRRASSSFLLLQTLGAHILWGLETPATYITLQPTFAGKVSPACWLCHITTMVLGSGGTRPSCRGPRSPS